jgi:hypothetical protein
MSVDVCNFLFPFQESSPLSLVLTFLIIRFNFKKFYDLHAECICVFILCSEQIANIALHSINLLKLTGYFTCHQV